MYQVFLNNNNIIIMNDDTEKRKELSEEESKILFKENSVLKKLEDKSVFRMFVDNIYGIKELP